MHELLNQTAIQAGLAPFLAGLIAAELFQRIRLSGLAVIAGFALTVYLASGFSFDPLTATRKIVLLGLVGAALGLLLSLAWLSWFSTLLPILGGAAAVWVALTVLRPQSPELVLLWGAGCAAYVAILVWSMDSLEHDSLRSASAGAALGLGTGGAALLGSSVLLGKFGLALGSATTALILIQMVFNHTFATGRVFTLPLALIAGTAGCMAVLGGHLPWYALPVLAAIPVITMLMPLPRMSLPLQSLLLAVPAFALAGGAVFITGIVTGRF
ncbi:MAG TPA: hypothetical protein VGD24_04335 [Gallionella sp.]